ncbi:MAG: SapC family protein [Parvularculaceae bacterium]
MSQTAPSMQISGTMFLFQRPELLNTQSHGDLGVRAAAKPFQFCANVRAIPLTISEIAEASRHYPVVFGSLEDLQPLAIVGLLDDVNLFVDENGHWDPYAYIPGYIRRYPFGLAAEQGGDRFALVIDAGFEGLDRNADAKLFAGGELSELSKQAMEFTKTYESDRRLTEQVLKQVKELDLISGQSAQYTPTAGGAPQAFAQYFGVDERKLAGLSDEEFLKVRKLNVLPILYSHLLSLGNWRNLILRRMRRFNMTETEAASVRRFS